MKLQTIVFSFLFSLSSLTFAHHSVLSQKISATEALLQKVRQVESQFQCSDSQINSQKDRVLETFSQSREEWLALNAVLPALEDRAHLDDQLRSLNEAMVVFIFGGAHFIGAWLGSFVYITEVDAPSLELRELAAKSKDVGLVKKEIIHLIKTLPPQEVKNTIDALFTGLKQSFNILSSELNTMRKATPPAVGRADLRRPWMNSRSSSLDYQMQATMISYHANAQALMSDILIALQENCNALTTPTR